MPETPQRSSRPWSIAGRLSHVHALKTLALLTAAGSILYWGLARELRQQDAKLVASKLTVLAHLVSSFPLGSEAIASEIQHEAGDEGPLRYYLRILEPSGRVIIETTGMPPALSVTAFPAHAAQGAATSNCAECAPSADDRYLLASRLADGVDGTGPVRLQVALDIERTEGVLRRYAWLLAVVLGAGVILSALASLLVSRMAVRPVYDIAGRVRAITASRLDLQPLSSRPWPTELQGLANDFDEMLARLGEAFNRLSQFAADLAHELRNPINNLRGNAEVTLARPRTAEEYQQSLGSSLEELERLSRLIDGLLFIARSEDPRQAIDSTSFPIRRELVAVQDFYEALAAERDVRTRCDGDATITGDPMLVRRAVSNLLANALKHTPPGGTVVLNAQQRSGGGATVTVRDNGCGIRPEHLPQLFDRFYRADDGATDRPGSGLGLAIVRSIMRLHGGEAKVESEFGVGTTVTLEVPARGDA
jgi:two-component system heavy metal sensor histidine kinase CusS